jgi:mono/diheme cytochrome c family protein
MPSRVTWWLLGATALGALALSVPLALGAGSRGTAGSRGGQSMPGTTAAGKGVFVAFCGKCHTFAAAGSRGTLGPNLDQDHVSFTEVVSAIEEGVGGIQAEYILRSVTFNQIYDVANFVVKDRTGPVIGGSEGSP